MGVTVPYASPFNTSGAVHFGLPQKVIVYSTRKRDSPKSAIFTPQLLNANRQVRVRLMNCR